MLIRTGDPKLKHIRGPKKIKQKPVPIIYDHLAREDAMRMYNQRRVDETWQNNIEQTIEPTIKRNTSIWRATFERVLDKLNHKLYALVEQVKESDRRADELNVDFHKQNYTLHNKYYADIDALNKESEKRNNGFMQQSQVKRFMNDLGTLARENSKRNAGFHHTKKSHEEKMSNIFFGIGEENQKRNASFFNPRQESDWERMNKMNANRTSLFTTKKPISSFDKVLKMNNNRNDLFVCSKPEFKKLNDLKNRKPLTKLEEVTTWNDSRNAVFNLRL